MQLHTVFALFILGWSLLLTDVQAIWSEGQVISMVNQNGSDSKPMIWELRPKRIKKSVSGISGTLTISDAPDDYNVELEIYHSPNRNNDWRKIPLQFPETSVCEKFNKEYRKFVMKEMKEVSDLPYTEDEDQELCSMLEVGRVYKVNNFVFDFENVMKAQPAGHYKIDIIVKKKGDTTAMVSMIADLMSF